MLVADVEGQTLNDALAFSADELLRLFRARLTPRQQCYLLAWQSLRRM